MTVAINGRFLVDSFGGVKRFGTELTTRLAGLRDDVVLLVPHGAAQHAPQGVRVEVVGRFGGPLWEQVELPLWLARHGRPLLVNFAGVAPILYSRQISTLHDIAPALRPQDFTRPFRLQWQLVVRWGMLRRGRRLVTDSGASRSEIAEYFGADEHRIDVVHLGADSIVSSTPAPASPNGRFVAFGRHGAGKNVRVILDALADVPATSDIRVEFLGRLDPELEPYAIQRGIPRERTVWRGPLSDEDLASALQNATAMIWPSKHEGFGLPPLEAQSLGVPVIASDIPVNREILEESAVYFPATDAAALIERMSELSSAVELRADLSERARENTKRFRWEHTAAQWNELIALAAG